MCGWRVGALSVFVFVFVMPSILFVLRILLDSLKLALQLLLVIQGLGFRIRLLL